MARVLISVGSPVRNTYLLRRRITKSGYSVIEAEAHMATPEHTVDCKGLTKEQRDLIEQFEADYNACAEIQSLG